MTPTCEHRSYYVAENGWRVCLKCGHAGPAPIDEAREAKGWEEAALYTDDAESQDDFMTGWRTADRLRLAETDATQDERVAAHREAKKRYGWGEQEVRRRVAFEDGAAWACQNGIENATATDAAEVEYRVFDSDGEFWAATNSLDEARGYLGQDSGGDARIEMAAWVRVDRLTSQ